MKKAKKRSRAANRLSRDALRRIKKDADAFDKMWPILLDALNIPAYAYDVSQGGELLSKALRGARNAREDIATLETALKARDSTIGVLRERCAAFRADRAIAQELSTGAFMVARAAAKCVTATEPAARSIIIATENAAHAVHAAVIVLDKRIPFAPDSHETGRAESDYAVAE